MTWSLPATDALANNAMPAISPGVVDYAKAKYAGVKPTNFVGGDEEVTSYSPLFLNDAMYDQPVLQSYGEGNNAALRAIQRKWDPEGFLAERTGGFKFV